MLLNPVAKLRQRGQRASIAASLGFAPGNLFFAGFANGFFDKIPFVDDDNARFAIFYDEVADFFVLFGDPGFGVQDEEGDVAASDGIFGAFGAEEFDGISDAAGFAQ